MSAQPFPEDSPPPRANAPVARPAESLPPGPEPAPPTILQTANPLVGVLVEPTQRRLVAQAPIAAGTVILTMDGRITDTATRYSVQIGPTEHLDPFDLLDGADRVRWRAWMYLNHACDPNATIHGRVVRAARAIAPGEGVTFDYNTTEWELAEPFACACGSPRCVGIVRGARHRPGSAPTP